MTIEDSGEGETERERGGVSHAAVVIEFFLSFPFSVFVQLVFTRRLHFAFTVMGRRDKDEQSQGRGGG